MNGQLCRDGSSLDRSLANDSDRTPYVNNGGRPSAWSRSSINDQIQRIANTMLAFVVCPGRRYACAIRTGAGYGSDLPQEVTQRLPGTKTDAHRASPRRYRIGESTRCREHDGERTGPEDIHEYASRRWDGLNEQSQLRPVSDQQENRFSLRPAFDLP